MKIRNGFVSNSSSSSYIVTSNKKIPDLILKRLLESSMFLSPQQIKKYLPEKFLKSKLVMLTNYDSLPAADWMKSARWCDGYYDKDLDCCVMYDNQTKEAIAKWCRDNLKIFDLDDNYAGLGGAFDETEYVCLNDEYNIWIKNKGNKPKLRKYVP